MVSAAGLFQTFSNGWNAMTAQVSKAYTGACNLTNAGWQKLMKYEAVQKTVNFSSPYINRATDLCKQNYPDALKFKWSTGTAVAATGTMLVVGGILKSFQSELSKINKEIDRLEAKEKALKEKGDYLTAGENEILDALKTRREELQPEK